MKELPGKLTKKTLELTREAGRDYIIYRGRYYKLEDLEDVAGIKRIKRESKVSENIHRDRANSGNGSFPSISGKSRKSEPLKGQES